MRFLFIAGFQLFFIHSLFSQVPGTGNARPIRSDATFKPQTFDSQVFLIDPNGKPFNRDYTDVENSPFLNNEFKLAKLVFVGGRTVDSVKVRLDVEHHDLQYLSGATPFIISPGKVVEVDFIEPIPNPSRKFKCGYPKVDNQDEHSFYNVLAEGKVYLLKVSRKKFVSNKNEMSGEVENRFDLYEDYYTASNDELKRLKRDKDFILSLLADQRAKLEAYVKENRINFKSDNDLAKLFAYYNTL